MLPWCSNQVGYMNSFIFSNFIPNLGFDYGLRNEMNIIDAGTTYFGITAGSDHTCGITDQGVKCWGRNQRGELGVDPSQFSQLLLPTLVNLTF